MPSKALTDAVEARLGATWNGIPVYGINQLGEPPANAPEFLVVQYPVANNRRVPIDRGLYQEEGAFRIVVNTGRGHGAGRALQLCDQLAALFRDKKFAGVTCRVPSSPFIDDSNDKGRFFQASIVFPYTLNFL